MDRIKNTKLLFNILSTRGAGFFAVGYSLYVLDTINPILEARFQDDYNYSKAENNFWPFFTLKACIVQVKWPPSSAIIIEFLLEILDNYIESKHYDFSPFEEINN